MSNNKTCQRCGWNWDARKPNPRSCPSCHSYKWNQGVRLATSVENAQAGKFIEIVDGGMEDWRFSQGKPQFADDGSVYRGQYLFQNPKQTRTVEVDPDDHDRVIGEA